MLFYSKSLKNGVKKPGRRSPVGPKAPMCSVCRQTCQPAKLGSGAGHAVGLRIRAAGEDHVFSVAPDGHARGRAVVTCLLEHTQRRLPGIDRLGTVTEQGWGQRVVRFYDPDGHIIEVGEEMKTVIERFLATGMTLEEVSVRTDVSVGDLTKLLNG